MRQLILLIVIVPFILLIVSELQQQFREIPEDELTDQQKVERALDGMTFNTPSEMDVLINREYVDNSKRERVKLIIVRSEGEYLPMSPRIDDKSVSVLSILRKDLPEYDFGVPENEQASYFRMLTSNQRDWNVVSLKTDKGYFSRWEQRTDLHQLIREE